MQTPNHPQAATRIWSRRNFGLDLARALAIAAVLVCHLPIVAPNVLPGAILTFLGILGVELFFVLSGLLIGDILLRETSATFDVRTLWRFWSRRWLRTLPAFAVAIGIAFWIRDATSWRYLLFLQNNDPRALDLLPVSWSLSIEEWFYLAFPVVLMALRRRLSSRTAFLVGIALFLCVPAILRLGLGLTQSLPWDITYRKQVPLRLDAPAFGLLLAWTRHHAPAVWSRLEGRALSLIGGLLLLAAAAAISTTLVLDAPARLRIDLGYLPLISTGSALTIAWLHGRKTWPRLAILRQIVLWGSLLSYGLYLVHWYIFFAWMPEAAAYPAAINIPGILIVTIAAALAMHLLIERPFLALRDRLTGHSQISS